MLPEYFAFQYDMRSGNEYAHRSLGESYTVEPKSAENSHFLAAGLYSILFD